MRGWWASLVAFCLTPAGLVVLAVVDSSPFFYAPLANDAVVVILAAQDPGRFWLYPLLAAAGATAGMGISFWVGRRIGESGIRRLVGDRRWETMKANARGRGEVALALTAIFPPPFPFTPLVMACGALDLRARHLLLTAGLVRLLRFLVEAVLAIAFGRAILGWLDSGAAQSAVLLLVIGGTVGTVVALARQVLHRGGGREEREPA